MLTEKEAVTESIKIWKELYETGEDKKPTYAKKFYLFCPICEYVREENGSRNCYKCLINWPTTTKTNRTEFCCNSYFGQWSDEPLEHKRKYYAKKILDLLENKLKEMEKVDIKVTDINVINNMIYDERGQEEGNYIKILREIRDNFGDLVISEDKNIQRLVGFHDDGDDYYYIMKSMHGEVSYESCVGRFIPIKGRIPTTDYEYLNNCFLYTEKMYKRD